MKPRVFIPATIAIATVVWLIQRSHLHQLREERVRVEPRITAEAVASASASASSQPPTGTEIVPEFKRLMLATYGDQHNGSPRQRERMISLLQQISPETLAEVIKELGQDPRFKDDAEYAILGHYVEIQPRAAIEIALGMPSRFDQNRFIYQNFLNAISELHDVWASKDPVASLQWLQSENSGIPEELHNRMFGNACRSLAYADPQATIAGILGDDHVDDGAIGQDIGRGMNSPDPIKAFFKAADELATDPSLDADRIASIRRGVADGMSILFFDQPFSTVTDLVNECLTADEKIAFVNRCNEQGTIVDSAKWASWLTTFEPSQMDSATAPPHPLVTRMESWAYEDPNGAGAWLDGMPDGPLKDQASAAYNEGLNHRTAGTAP